jgi:septum formation protein
MIYSWIPEHYHITLASRSPRRQQLLREAGLVFDVIVKEYCEEWPPKLKGREIAEFLARKKAQVTIDENTGENDIIITADTIVWCDGKVLDKPSTYTDAFEILRAISGKTHEVITGVGFVSGKYLHSFSETTLVTFDHLSDDQIDFYIKNFNPSDKAGAYGIQEWIGITGISRIEGSYFNVMGLPVNRLLRELREFITVIEKDKRQ